MNAGFIATIIYGLVILLAAISEFTLSKNPFPLIAEAIISLLIIGCSILMLYELYAGKTIALLAALLLILFFGLKAAKALKSKMPITHPVILMSASALELVILLGFC